jgi:hypothetical protein
VIHPPELPAIVAAETPSSEAGRNLARNVRGFLTCRKILHGTDGFSSSPKGIVLWIFITLKTPSFSAGFELTNLGSNGKQDNH